MLLGWRCPVCAAVGTVPCEACAATMEPSGRIPPIVGVDWCAALLVYRGAARELVARAKYRNQRTGLAWLAAGMTELVRGWSPSGATTPHTGLDVVTWAPANPAHVRQRGFDHGELLARAVARHLALPVAALLNRASGAPLTGRSAAQRLAGPPLRPRRAGRAYPLANASVLVVDDVITTGATLAAAARTLRSLGATSVFAVAAAHTPVGRSALSPPRHEDVPCG